MRVVYSFLFYVRQKKWKTGSYLQQAGNNMALNPQVFCQQIAKKNTLW